jgi:ubiquinone/menaquinone biosynthesis C-methylase UbiE
VTRQFTDHFSPVAGSYGKHRPAYPDELFRSVAAAAPSNERAWDAGTGSGQGAVRLAEHFEEVIATDASAAQIENAWPRPNVTYRVEPAEQTSLADGSVDLATAGQAAHWFQIDDYYAEVRRVLKPDGVLAIWCYGLESVDDDVNRVIEKLYVELLGPYWPKRTLPDHTYQDIPFPFDELPRRVFRMHMDWSLDQLVNGFRTWSAADRYTKARGVDPVDVIGDEFREAWGDPDEVRRVSWPVYLRMGVRA